MEAFRLYGFTGSGNCEKVRMAADFLSLLLPGHSSLAVANGTAFDKVVLALASPVQAR